MPVYSYTAIDDPAASNFTSALGINNAGQIVGQYFDSIYHGFLYTGGTYSNFDEPSANGTTSASGINDAGQIVGYYSDGSVTHGFLLNGGAYTTLNPGFVNADMSQPSSLTTPHA